jgi:hypothetical protein
MLFISNLNTSMNTNPIPKWQFWTGWVLSGLVILAFAFAGAMKFVPPDEAAKVELAKVGGDPAKVPVLGVTEIACTVLYAIPQTAVLGAVLLTGYMGGAIATHARIADPFVAQAIIGVLVWAGLWLREPRLRAILPFRR